MINDKPARRRRAGLVIATLALATAPMPARAQFFWDQSGLSADDAARAVMARGFQVLARPVRNEDVYVAQVIDRRGLREQLIIASDSGQILQRSIVGPRHFARRYADPTIPPGPIPPGSIPNEDHDPGLLSRLFGNNDDGADQPPPAVDRPFIEPDRSVRPLRPRRPRVVEQSPETIRPSPVESEPLAPPSAATIIPPRAAPPAPVVHRAPAQAALPPPTVTPKIATPAALPAPVPAPSDRPVRSISSNPLAIPGSREQDEKASRPPARPATPATEQAKASLPKPPVEPAPAKSVAPTPAKDAVPVAPLD